MKPNEMRFAKSETIYFAGVIFILIAEFLLFLHLHKAHPQNV